jgi:hemerythrin-like domain-containing protein
MRVRHSRQEVISTIRRDHRSIMAVLDSMLYLIRAVNIYGTGINVQAMRAMTYYIDQFPERLHHLREEQYFFPAVLKRAPQTAAILSALKREHIQGAQKMLELEQALVRFEAGGPTKFHRYRVAVEDYARFYRAHMQAEEGKILPAAIESLTAEDWSQMAQVFRGGIDSPEGEFRALFTHIANITPAPVGFAATTR